MDRYINLGAGRHACRKPLIHHIHITVYTATQSRRTPKGLGLGRVGLKEHAADVLVHLFIFLWLSWVGFELVRWWVWVGVYMYI